MPSRLFDAHVIIGTHHVVAGDVGDLASELRGAALLLKDLPVEAHV